jgi:hypothetical protein
MNNGGFKYRHRKIVIFLSIFSFVLALTLSFSEIPVLGFIWFCTGFTLGAKAFKLYRKNDSNKAVFPIR